nr:ribonuclease H-like domain-containing protein [Tanacetum cinerariifolium]
MYDMDDDASISRKLCEHFSWDCPEKDSPGTEVDWQDEPLHEPKDFFVRLNISIQVVVVQNNVQQEVVGEVVLYPLVHEEVAEEVIEMANDQAEALSDQEVVDECLDNEQRNPTSIISDQTIAHLKAQLVENGVVRVMIPKCMSWLDAYDEPKGDMEDKVDNSSPQSTPQVLPSFKVYTSSVTYPKEVYETIGISMEVEPLNHTKLEDLVLNTSNHDIPLSYRKIPSVDEPEP